MLIPQTLIEINTRNIYDCLDNAKFEAKSLSEQNIILEFQLYILKVDILILESNNQCDLKSIRLTFDKVCRKFILLSKQIELMIKSSMLLTQNWLYEALKQTKKLIIEIQEATVRFCD
ncbi:hypothetical protein [Photobacterium aquimaris]|uniref:Uncharacterized protein n=1 Tax=Photobacterium aquimaris TaxID=512643 RepID=A0A1Y6KUG5_9GAMM|nr:hypothetical protein [Photobacterium aquimaris]SMY15833.1 hypothetical protein PAQU9191_01064 [Photobacterium aquimaris]